jgi:hypothetical protein
MNECFRPERSLVDGSGSLIKGNVKHWTPDPALGNSDKPTSITSTLPSKERKRQHVLGFPAGINMLDQRSPVFHVRILEYSSNDQVCTALPFPVRLLSSPQRPSPSFIYSLHENCLEEDFSLKSIFLEDLVQCFSLFHISDEEVEPIEKYLIPLSDSHTVLA